MEYQKKFLIAVLSFMLLVSISCNNEDKTGGGTGTGGKTERNLSYYMGDWWGKMPSSSGEQHLISIKSDGSIIVANIVVGGSDNLVVASSKITKNSDTSYTFGFSDSSSGSTIVTFNLNFTSDTQGIMSVSNSLISTTSQVDIAKK